MNSENNTNGSNVERNAVLEEAARLCESGDQQHEIGKFCAVAIRALKSAAPAKPEPAVPENILVPKWVGQFDTHQDWVRRAQRVLSVPEHMPKAICVDAMGRRCNIGADMRRANEEDAFPVRYFWECEFTAAPVAQPLAPSDQRARFETYCHDGDRLGTARYGDDYAEHDTQAAWLAVKALAAQPLAPSAAVLDERAWMIWLHGPGGVFENKDDAQLEFERRNKLFPDAARQVLELRPAVQPLAGQNVRVVIEGWQLVPIEPTDEMRAACLTLNYQDEIDAEWSAMLAAAPSPVNPK